MVDEVQRRTAEREVEVAETEIARLDEEIKTLERRRSEQVRLRDKAKLTASGVDPCRACNRLVPSPCHDAGGFHEAGPWDFSCRDVFYPSR